MRIVPLAGVLLACVMSVVPVRAADDLVERLATCQTSWLDWKDDPVQTHALAETFNATFVQKPDGNTWVPRSRVLVAGLPVVQAFPDSVGMGVGFSVIVDASFDKTRQSLEKAVGKSLGHCETSDNMRTCDLELGEKRTLTLMSGDNGKGKTTLLGCYYYYAR